MSVKILLIFVSALLVLNTNGVFAQEFPSYNLKVETIAENLEVPWAIAFSPDGRIFFTERDGNVRIIEDGITLQEPALTLNVGRIEGGLLGLALDPEFEKNHYLYLYYTYSELLSTYNRVSRFTENDNKLSDEFVLIDKIPGAAVHDGGRIRFGPDNKLYITTGDAANAPLAQDLRSLAGKVLRINSDGTIPADNPFSGSAVYSLGHRNPQGLDWEPVTGKLVVAEHGPSGERGFAHDEINIVEAGKNYGWPNIVGSQTDPRYISPIFHTGEIAWAPSGASFYNSDKIPELKGKYLVANLRGTHLHAFEIDTEQNEIISDESLFSGQFGRLRDISVGNDGYLYMLTSNRDGRGSPTPNDDRILRIMPLLETTSYPPPLKQLKNGVSPYDIKCSDDYVLVLKQMNNSPACVKPATAAKMIQRGWFSTDPTQVV
ncbi:MAG TPA: PQQ-dependent sugar dehydrogenase [Candidatus Nitrosotenuis sp.]